ncbi:mRNA surveillance protein pelota [Methanobrevibacter sp.]|uniref:mRNA surveillance protein pelota n=1 Tax=Methanobrevibacter sp. TaxID=66852 RepID=UPI0026E07610|nr:mRNA surveillance protein pelota [Methanobrevibacter sp.]MDO5823572.1 mRNA surveillance protein pelota [Methanobrevibacter sp.]
MKIIKQDTKEGIIELVPETLDDLWHLSHIIETGDNASSKTTRRIQDNTGDKLRSDRGVKKTFYLGLDIENITFHLFTGKLRLTGVITRGPEDLIPLGSHHTLEVKLNTPLTIKKQRWQNWAIKRLNQAIDASKKLSAMIIVLEDDTATIGLMRQFGIEYYGPVKGHVSGKRIIDKNRQKNIVQFYEKVIESIEKFDSIQNIVIAGPGFVKNDFHDYLKEKHKSLAKMSVIEATGSGGRNGISEVLKKGTVEKLTSENRVAVEMGAIDKLLAQIGKNSSKIAYGIKQTKEAINLGAVSQLLILDTKVASENMGELMDMVENMKGEVMVISSEHEGGKQLESLGGMAAILRYEIA